MDVLLLSGYRTSEQESDQPLGLRENHLDRRILQFRELGLNIIVVLGGPYADEVLRKSQLLASCELVYDTSDKPNLLSNIKAGLRACDKSCFIHPVEVPCPGQWAWVALKTELQKAGVATNVHIFQICDKEGAPWHFGFPILLSPLGACRLLDIQNLTGLTDPRLNYLRTFHRETELLAPKPSNI